MIGVGDKVLQYSTHPRYPPEGRASILWKSAEVPLAAAEARWVHHCLKRHHPGTATMEGDGGL